MVLLQHLQEDGRGVACSKDASACAGCSLGVPDMGARARQEVGFWAAGGLASGVGLQEADVHGCTASLQMIILDIVVQGKGRCMHVFTQKACVHGTNLDTHFIDALVCFVKHSLSIQWSISVSQHIAMLFSPRSAKKLLVINHSATHILLPLNRQQSIQQIHAPRQCREAIEEGNSCPICTSSAQKVNPHLLLDCQGR